NHWVPLAYECESGPHACNHRFATRLWVKSHSYHIQRNNHRYKADAVQPETPRCPKRFERQATYNWPDYAGKIELDRIKGDCICQSSRLYKRGHKSEVCCPAERLSGARKK